MWIHSGKCSARLFQIEACEQFLEGKEGRDVFRLVMSQPLIPIYNCSKERFAAMCLCVSKQNHVR